jgi:hypothetical protein
MVAASMMGMTVIAIVSIILLLGSFFLASELFSAPTGYEDETGFHSLGKQKESRGSRVLRKGKRFAPVHSTAFAGTR